MKACAPGKLIISGEHAVVHGSPALAVAVQQYSHVSFDASPVKCKAGSAAIETQFTDVAAPQTVPLNSLCAWVETIDARFEDYLNGRCAVGEITQNPNELALYSLLQLGEQANSLPSGILRSQTDLPLGSGMGSSASIIAALLVLSEQLFSQPQSKAERFELVRHCERLQHGRGSAIDAATVTYGGMVNVQNDRIQTLSPTLDEHWFWTYTGKPDNSTGECVQQVREQHGHDALLWNDFTQITHAIESALMKHADASTMLDLIQHNHRLLTHIGVVPKAAQTLIADIESAGGAAKISGAGAITGEGGGLVLAYLPDDSRQRLDDSMGKQTPRWQSIKIDTLGARTEPVITNS